MIIAITCVIAIAVLAFVLRIRPEDLRPPEPVSPFAHLDERKVAIYENLRDLQFEYRLGKLSDDDYQSAKKDLQRELAGVLAAVDDLRAKLRAELKDQPSAASTAQNGASRPPKAAKPAPKAVGFVCGACGAKFEKELKFCGECGKPMKVVQE